MKKPSECQMILGAFALFLVVWVVLKLMGIEMAGQSKHETLDKGTLRKYVNDPRVGYVGPLNTTYNTGVAVLGDPFVNPAPLYSDSTDALWSLNPPFNPIASGY